jgi:hypothetical protein
MLNVWEVGIMAKYYYIFFIDNYLFILLAMFQ